MISIRFKNGKVTKVVTYSANWEIIKYPNGDKLVLTRNIMMGDELITSFIILEKNKVNHYFIKDGDRDHINLVRSHPIDLGNPISGCLELYNEDLSDDLIAFNFRNEKTQSLMEFLDIDKIERSTPNIEFGYPKYDFITDGVAHTTSEKVKVSLANYLILEDRKTNTRKLISSQSPFKIMTQLVSSMENGSYPHVI